MRSLAELLAAEVSNFLSYQIVTGAATGAAASEEEPKQSANFSTFQKGGEVNLDAMSMAVLNKQLRKRHG
jgi:hypothetical protein